MSESAEQRARGVCLPAGISRAELQETREFIAIAIRDAEKAARLKAIEECKKIAVERSVACQKSVRSYKERYPDDTPEHRYWWASERCAQQEADYISEQIVKLGHKER